MELPLADLKTTAALIELFKKWFEDAKQQEKFDHTAMSLATVDSEGQPSNRIVLLKEVSTQGFAFYTNYHSRKAKELEAAKKAALLFWWPTLGRQIRIEGPISLTTEAESDAYFSTRPLESRLGAIASQQSETLGSREELWEKVKALEKEYRAKKMEPPRPANWGGYWLKPVKMEFWQNGDFRLHDRFLFDLQKDGSWNSRRLFP